jgi:hypothetical protein
MQSSFSVCDSMCRAQLWGYPSENNLLSALAEHISDLEIFVSLHGENNTLDIRQRE